MVRGGAPGNRGSSSGWVGLHPPGDKESRLTAAVFAAAICVGLPDGERGADSGLSPGTVLCAGCPGSDEHRDRPAVHVDLGSTRWATRLPLGDYVTVDPLVAVSSSVTALGDRRLMMEHPIGDPPGTDNGWRPLGRGCERMHHRGRASDTVVKGVHRPLPAPTVGTCCSATAVGPRQDDELLGRPGHRDVAVDGALDAGAERLRVDEDDQVELQTLRQLRGQRPDPGVAANVGVADDAGDALGVLGEPGLEDRSEIGGRRRARTGRPLLRIDVGTFASGSAARMTGSASAITSSGVR